MIIECLNIAIWHVNRWIIFCFFWHFCDYVIEGILMTVTFCIYNNQLPFLSQWILFRKTFCCKQWLCGSLVRQVMWFLPLYLLVCFYQYDFYQCAWQMIRTWWRLQTHMTTIMCSHVIRDHAEWDGSLSQQSYALGIIMEYF